MKQILNKTVARWLFQRVLKLKSPIWPMFLAEEGPPPKFEIDKI